MVVKPNTEPQQEQDTDMKKDVPNDNHIYGSFHSAKDKKSELVFYQDL